MKPLVTLLCLTSLCYAQGGGGKTPTPAQQDAAQALQAFQLLATPISTLASLLAKLQTDTVPPAADPVVLLLQKAIQPSGVSIYSSLLTCAASPQCSIVEVTAVCARPAAWAPNTSYATGALVSDAAQNIYRNTGTGGVSLATTPAWSSSGSTDGPNTWALLYTASVPFYCSVSGSIP